MNKAHIVIHTHESSPGWLLKLTQATVLPHDPGTITASGDVNHA